MSENGIRGCNAAANWKASPTRYVVKRANLFNSRRSECAPMFWEATMTYSISALPTIKHRVIKKRHYRTEKQ